MPSRCRPYDLSRSPATSRSWRDRDLCPARSFARWAIGCPARRPGRWSGGSPVFTSRRRGANGRGAAADPSRPEGAIEAARVQIWLADHEPDAEGRQRAATLAVQAAQWCGRIAPPSPGCDYWLGAGLGVQARERPSTGLSALPRITEAFKRAAAGDPSLDHSGPDRALALLYVRAPGWPAGPGDPDLGLEHARKAGDRDPDYPPNLLTLAEALALNGDGAGSREANAPGLERARPLAAPTLTPPRRIDEAEKALGEVP